MFRLNNLFLQNFNTMAKNLLSLLMIAFCLISGYTLSGQEIDTSGLYSWPILNNGDDDWENGAFNRNSLGHPDYGWGVYNEFTHDVVGDSIYVIKLVNGAYKKLWIVDKASSLNIYNFKYANIDGTNEQSIELENNNYNKK